MNVTAIAGAVFAFFGARISANSNSFHEKMNARIQDNTTNRGGSFLMGLMMAARSGLAWRSIFRRGWLWNFVSA